MKFTKWEKVLLHDVLGLIKSENILETETLLAVRKKLQPRQKELDECEANADSIHKHMNEDISLTRRELSYIIKKIEMESMKLPSDDEYGPRAIALWKKFTKKQKDMEEV